MLEKVAAIIREQLNQENVEITEATRFKEDLEVDSLYNTYKYTGLPVGPICNPGQVSMEAVLNPAQHNYLYYHVDNEETGSHIFTETYQEHVETQ